MPELRVVVSGPAGSCLSNCFSAARSPARMPLPQLVPHLPLHRGRSYKLAGPSGRLPSPATCPQGTRH